MPTAFDPVRADLDHIARLEAQPWEMDDGYGERLLERLPVPCGRALEIGCGTGRITRRMADRCGEVVAIDASPEMIRAAMARSEGHTSIRYENVDFERFQAMPDSFDAVVSVATLHHLPLRSSLARMRDWVRPGGALLILDVGWPQGLRGLSQRALASSKEAPVVDSVLTWNSCFLVTLRRSYVALRFVAPVLRQGR